MKIKVESPFDKDWKYAYIVSNRENRKMVCLFNAINKRTTISYARYLMSVKLGRILDKNEQVDHIDNNKTNDSIDNLQLMKPEENRQKYFDTLQPKNIHGTYTMYHKGCRCSLCVEYHRRYRSNLKIRKNIEKICIHCGNVFLTDRSHKNKKYCSVNCANKATSLTHSKIKDSNDNILKTKEKLKTWSATARKYGVTISALKYKLGIYKH